LVGDSCAFYFIRDVLLDGGEAAEVPKNEPHEASFLGFNAAVKPDDSRSFQALVRQRFTSTVRALRRAGKQGFRGIICKVANEPKYKAFQ
jgi:hypothetical protein